MLKSHPRFRPLLATLLALILLASACGGGSDGEPVSTGTDEQPDPEPSDDAPSDEETDESDEAEPSETDESDDAAQDGVAPETIPATSQLDDLTTKPLVGTDLLGPVTELIKTDVVEGDGDEAVAGSSVSMQYVGVLAADGTQFDASWDRGQPFEFVLGQGQVIAGWDDGIEGMKVGGRRVLQIPSAQAYGEQPRGDIIGANADLLFVVDLISAEPPANPPQPSPPIPDDALGSFDELNIIEVTEGTGRGVEFGDIIEVQYVGVNADDGEEFDSSWSRGAIPFRIVAGRSAVIQGWTDGLIGLKLGGERILQIPSDQAYGEGDLVFLVQLDKLIDAPYAHTVEFSGPAPADVEITTITQGTGDEIELGDEIEVDLAVITHSENTLLSSSWENDESTGLILQEGALLPGLTDAIAGAKIGEVRQIILPLSVAYPDGVPEQLGLADDDALVFVIEILGLN